MTAQKMTKKGEYLKNVYERGTIFLGGHNIYPCPSMGEGETLFMYDPPGGRGGEEEYGLLT